MNVLLLYPEFPDTFWSFKHALKFVRKKAASPPLGLLTVAAMLPSAWGKRLVDVNVAKLTEKDLAWADYVFISGMVVQKESARQLIARCKEAGLKIIAGGPLFTSEHEQFDQVDHFVLNEAEVTLAPFLRDLEQGCAQRVYETSEFPDIQETPVPLWELADLKRYASMNIQFSRGCPYNCEFCNITKLFGHRPRLKTSGQIVAELDGLYALGWRGGIFFVDDNFIGNKRHLKTDLLPALIEWRNDKRKITFNTEVSIDLADDEDLMRMMVEAGFDSVFIGIETPDEESLAECSKRQNKNRELSEDVKRIQRAGMQVSGGFIVGFDHDTPSIFQRQIDFIQKSGIMTAMVGLLQAPIGTRLYDRLKREGRLLGSMSGDNVDGTTNIIPKMNLDTLREGYKKILRDIYSPKNYYERVKTFLREYKPPRIKASLDFGRLLAFFRSIGYLGILGKERIHYWKLLLWTLLRRPELLPVATQCAIYGYHFRKVCELHVR
ncbi:MAG: B12-binding domain-containing radical SAM protein [Candidatus Latescibacterota bacterium]|nr:MAG: B12-binding domain-containing radical SAM protein [Candidatus Latescibacterota bacterium]